PTSLSRRATLLPVSPRTATPAIGGNLDFSCYDRRMKLAIVASCVWVASAHADPLYTCKEASPTTKLEVAFKPEISLVELATWTLSFTCKNIVFTPEVAKHATRLHIIVPKPMTPKQALQLFVDAVEATGLVVTVKADTIVIKLGPGMPTGCPDVASALPAPPTPPIAPPVATAPDAKLAQAAIDAGIREIDPPTHEITEAHLDHIVANRSAACKGARGGTGNDGLKLYAIRAGSVLAKLGFMNGDTLVSINGFAVNSADRALEVYTKIRDARTLELDVVRRGKP